MFYRNKVINQFHSQLSIVVLVTNSLTTYMTRAHEYAKGMWNYCRVYMSWLAAWHGG